NRDDFGIEHEVEVRLTRQSVDGVMERRILELNEGKHLKPVIELLLKGGQFFGRRVPGEQAMDTAARWHADLIQRVGASGWTSRDDVVLAIVRELNGVNHSPDSLLMFQRPLIFSSFDYSQIKQARRHRVCEA